MLDIIWLLPAIAVALSIVLAYKIGTEVGRDRGRREQQARDRHPSVRARRVRQNKDVQYYESSKGTIIKVVK